MLERHPGESDDSRWGETGVTAHPQQHTHSWESGGSSQRSAGCCCTEENRRTQR